MNMLYFWVRRICYTLKTLLVGVPIVLHESILGDLRQLMSEGVQL